MGTERNFLEQGLTGSWVATCERGNRAWYGYGTTKTEAEIDLVQQLRNDKEGRVLYYAA